LEGGDVAIRVVRDVDLGDPGTQVLRAMGQVLGLEPRVVFFDGFVEVLRASDGDVSISERERP